MVLSTSVEFRRQVAMWTALPMSCLSLSFLIIVSIMLAIGPYYLLLEGGDPTAEATTAKATTATAPGAETTEETKRPVVRWISKKQATNSIHDCLSLLWLIWPFFFLELLYLIIVHDGKVSFWRQRYMALVNGFCPPLRMCARNYDMDGKIWFPSMGWQTADRDLRERLEKMFSVPMILIALAILPVLLIDFGMTQQVKTRPWLQIVLDASTGVIWFAFAAEFIVMVSVAEKKLRYCREHWVDLAIIVLPFISFLRGLRVVRAMRVARLAKVQQLTRMGRLYRLRGLAIRALRALIILKLLNRLFRISPDRQLRKLRNVLKERETEIEVLRREITELERQVADQKEKE